MTTLREAAQQALDYIRSTTDYKMGHPPACEAALDLADALAEPELAPAPGYCKHCKQYTVEEPLPPEQQSAEHVEPVALVRTWREDGKRRAELWDWGVRFEALPDGKHELYTTPQPRRRLSEQAIRDLIERVPVDVGTSDLIDFARAVEGAIFGDKV